MRSSAPVGTTCNYLGATVHNDDSLIVLVNVRGIVMRTGLVSDEELARMLPMS